MWEEGGNQSAFLFHPAGSFGVDEDEIALEHKDTAFLAAATLATEDAAGGAAFWDWWLGEAIPAAWRAVPVWSPEQPLADGTRLRVRQLAERWRDPDDEGGWRLSRDGTRLLTARDPGLLRLWDLEHAQEVALHGDVSGAHNLRDFSVAG
jgi:hypothetical protein